MGTRGTKNESTTLLIRWQPFSHEEEEEEVEAEEKRYSGMYTFGNDKAGSLILFYFQYNGIEIYIYAHVTCERQAQAQAQVKGII